MLHPVLVKPRDQWQILPSPPLEPTNLLDRAHRHEHVASPNAIRRAKGGELDVLSSFFTAVTIRSGMAYRRFTRFCLTCGASGYGNPTKLKEALVAHCTFR